MWVDQGDEFYNNVFKRFLKKITLKFTKANTLAKIIKYLHFFCSFVKLIAGLFIEISYIAFEITFING